MLRSRSFWLVAAALAIVAAPFFLPGGTSEFKGADDRGAEAIAEARPGYEPWFKPLWKPPSDEVTTGLFALQAALGGGLLGYVIGRRSAKHVADR
ncbi:cobalt/nickel transport protein [Rhodoblastus acidophilus]|uniref:Cobalt transport protein CbiN n=1 Tax=Rhodoblastus acidophilus TaxID=1074 RepID=A0A212S1D2_RHOAC|nr:energy-coupling factor ABC transporter substrate-binding protein [Rhodoblastus acidophilus]PPQ38204.1 energy-coupling factor ABC transporter substrate-binding protein [Rhodoblastus acidophilus]RAI17447.1 cobalt ABC transporter substrate-binding protein CbiN [Rhodoblastus acidophilus]SNB78826.1 cobalt/nickel transport protein [Rhodoblastus acidophilus]